MPLKRDRAFVLGVVPLREKDRIVTFLTREAGLKRGVARGARRLQSVFAGSLEPMSEVEVLFFEKEGRDLHRIDSVELVRSSFPLSAALAPALLISAMAESLQTFVADSDPSEKFFRLGRHCLDALFAGADPRPVSVYFDLWILKLSGVLPSAATCAACGGDLAGERLYLDPALPGFVHARCAGPGAVRLSREFGPALRTLLTRMIPAVAIAPRALMEVSRVAARLRSHFLGHELKSQRVLAGIW